MTIRVALHHRTSYAFDPAVGLSPHDVRLRPAAHCRTPIESYSFTVRPAKHFINWQQDPYGNWVARLVFPEKARSLEITVDLVADMTVINPFDFFVDKTAEQFPFAYTPDNARELAPYLELEPLTPRLADWVERARARRLAAPITTIDFLVGVNGDLQRDVKYLIRMEAGIQSPEHTLESAQGSCRDSAWLLVQILRRFGLAARFASGYLIQLTADQKPLDGPGGTDHDFTDLHAWCEAYVPGAGWIGLDPTSGLLAGEGHIPLACTALPSSAAPVTGFTDTCRTEFDFEMKVTRIHEDPRVTRPFDDAQWAAIEHLGRQVDRELADGDTRLTMGGEPTFVSIDDMDGPEWNYTPTSPRKVELAVDLLRRLRERFAPGAVLHFGQGKWYPGEELPRWAYSCFWRRDGTPLWQDSSPQPDGIDPSGRQSPRLDPPTAQDASRFATQLAKALGLSPDFVLPAYEDPWKILRDESHLPPDLDPLSGDLADGAVRARLAAEVAGTLGVPAGFILPVKALARRKSADATAWASSRWPLRRGHVFLLEGNSPIGWRLPLASLPAVLPEDDEPVIATDPFERRDALGERGTAPAGNGAGDAAAPDPRAREVVRTCLCVQLRESRLHVFLPPVSLMEDFVSLVAAIESTSRALGQPVRLEGYAPPDDPRIARFAITPDPGVIEVNIHPAAGWDELVRHVSVLYEEARLARLGTEKFMLDGRHTGTGGGNHVTLGGPTAADSPLLRRPDLLRSLISYWQVHPSLSYLFSGLFIGPTSQSPRVDEARDDALYELEIAFEQLDAALPPGESNEKPWLVDRILRNFLVDLTGNTHRAEFSIDKLYAPGTATGRLGLLEFRAFEMPPHARMSLLQMLLVRALVARFWKTPFRGRLVDWGTRLHDAFMLPHFVAQDLRHVVEDLQGAGYDFRLAWFAPFLEFRFPRFGTVTYEGIELEIRQAIEPWHVLGEEVSKVGTARYVDASVERLQVHASNLNTTRYAVACNGRRVPLAAAGRPGEYVAGVRYKAWAPTFALHPTIEPQAPLVFDIVDLWNGRSIGGCTYHVAHPGGRNYETFPVNALEAEARRVARFQAMGHSPGPMTLAEEARNSRFPLTLDLRKGPEAAA
ncbi:MAG TPA: transglutaminase family protein [Usitatibacteraceae bacterium]|nr:transglutaminase family protein [Usitatibacteraceae bacterium]